MVSACPFCSTNLQDGIRESNSKLQYYDISELILMALGKESDKSKQSKASEVV